MRQPKRYVFLLLLILAAGVAWSQFKPAIKGLDRTGAAGPPGPSTSPAGASSDVQINNSGAFGSNANFRYFTGTGNLVVGASTDAGTADKLQVEGNARFSSAGSTELMVGTTASSGNTAILSLRSADQKWLFYHNPDSQSLTLYEAVGARDLMTFFAVGAPGGMRARFNFPIVQQTYGDSLQIGTPASPASGYIRTYAKTGAGLCQVDSGGVETCYGAGGGPGSMSIQNNGTTTGSRATLDLIAGNGVTIAGSDTGTKIQQQFALTNPVLTGVGSPSGVVTASPGALYTSSSGGVGTTFYVKQTGTATNTGWSAGVALSSSSRLCEVRITPASGPKLSEADDEAASCFNGFGAPETITGVWCRADAGTPNVNATLTGGNATSILAHTLACGAGTFAAGLVNGMPTLTAGGSIDTKIIRAGGTAQKIRLIVRLSR